MSYKPILRSGQIVGRQEFGFGQLVDQDMEPIFMVSLFIHQLQLCQHCMKVHSS